MTYFEHVHMVLRVGSAKSQCPRLSCSGGSVELFCWLLRVQSCHTLSHKSTPRLELSVSASAGSASSCKQGPGEELPLAPSTLADLFASRGGEHGEGDAAAAAAAAPELTDVPAKQHKESKICQCTVQLANVVTVNGLPGAVPLIMAPPHGES